MGHLMAVVAAAALLALGRRADASNIVARMPEPTPAAIGYMANIGTSPRPTHPPGLPQNVPRELMRRQSNSQSASASASIPYPPPGFYCGLVESDPANALTCVNARANCVYTGDAVGCCISSDIQSCTDVATTCVGWDDDCDDDCRKDPRIMQCTVTTQPYCAAYDFGGSSTLWACQEVEAGPSSVQALSDYYSSALGSDYTTIPITSRSVSSQSEEDDSTASSGQSGSASETADPPDVGESTSKPTARPQGGDGDDEEDGGGGGGGGLSGGAIAGIVVGVVAAVAALIAFLAWIFLVKRKQQQQQQTSSQQPPVAEQQHHQYPPQQPPPPPQGGGGGGAAEAPGSHIPAAVAGGYYLPENKPSTDFNPHQPPGYATYDPSNPQRTFTPPPPPPAAAPGQQSPALAPAHMQAPPSEMPDSSFHHGHPPPPGSGSPHPTEGVSSPGSGSVGPTTPGQAPPAPAPAPGQNQQPVYEMGTG